MIRLLFTYNHELLFFDIENKKITYRDRKWPMGINFIPKDHDFVRTVIMSRNRIAAEMIRWINDANSGKNLEEWEACKDDYEVAEVIKREAKMKGCVFRQLFTEEELAKQKLENGKILDTINKQEENTQVKHQVEITKESPENIVEGEPQ